MRGNTTFLDFLREADASQGRGNDELVRALVPLFKQVLEHHDHGRVAPLVGVDKIFADGGHLWFHDRDALPPRIDKTELRVRELRRDGGVEIVDRTAQLVDVDDHRFEVVSKLVRRNDEAIAYPVYLPGYLSWEDEVGHHDALTDVFALGMLLASLAIGADFTEPDELEQFVVARHRLTELSRTLHPVIAKAIVRMTEVDRHARAADLAGIVQRLEHYREVDETVDRDIDFRSIEGFVHGNRSSRRKLILQQLQSRLFDMSRRNRLVWYKPTLQTLDLTEASVPTQLDVSRISVDDLMLWEGGVRSALTDQRPLRLDRYLRFEETPYARGALDKLRSESRRDEAEYGFSQLKLVIAFFNWHNFRDAPDERIRSPLLLLPVRLDKKRGVRDSYVLTPLTELAEFNPMLRHVLHELYALDLPELVDLSTTDLGTLHKALAAEIARSEPGITLRCIRKPQIRLVHERARRRLAAWRRRSALTGRGICHRGDVPYSYGRANFQPLGLQLLLHKVKPERLGLAEHFASASPVSSTPAEPTEPETRETSRDAYTITEEAAGRFDWALDLTHLTLGNFNYRKMSLVRDYDRFLQDSRDQEHPAFDKLFALDARDIEQPPSGATDPLAAHVVVPADPTQLAALQWARAGRDFIIQGPPGTGKSQTITNLIADFAGRGQRVLFVCEKRAALDVVFNRLRQHGLDEITVVIHDSQADKKPFVTELGATYERWLQGLEAATDDDASLRERVKGTLDEPLDALARFSEAMTAPAAGASVSVIEVLSSAVPSGVPPALSLEQKERVPSHASWQQQRDAVLALGRALAELRESTVIADLPLCKLNAAILDAAEPLAALRDGLAEIDQHLEAVGQAKRLVRDGATAAELNEALALALEFHPLAEHDALALLDKDSAPSRELDDTVRSHRQRTRALGKARDETSRWRDKLARSELVPALDLARRLERIFVLFVIFLPAWWRMRKLIRSRYDMAHHGVVPTWTAILQALSDEYARQDELEELEERARERFPLGGSPPELAKKVRELRSAKGRTPLQLSLRDQWTKRGPAEVFALRAAARDIEALAAAVRAVFDAMEGVPVDELADTVRRVRDAADLLPELKAPLRALAGGDPSVRRAVGSVPIAAAEWDAAVRAVTLERTFRANRPLARFDHESLDRRCRQIDDQYRSWLAANAQAVRAQVRSRFQQRARICTTPAAQLSSDDKALKKVYNTGRRVLERELKKSMRYKSIRELSTGDAGTVLYDLKPVWLMSPLSISDTIPSDEMRFDVVIFDEASQIPLEEAVSAVYRAPQMIVVGDEMQLPPTTFFAAKRDGDAEGDDALDAHYDLDADSFLTHAARRLPSTMLGWHYRSRSEALIRFSNQAFYGGQLLTVPDREIARRRTAIVVGEAKEGDVNAALVLDRPISFHRLHHGVYGSRRNPAEAAYIAHLVRGLLRDPQHHSIGIVAFSEAQQAQIESALTELASEDDNFRSRLEAEYEREEEDQHVGLFVKNLENVQGDERDIIVMSICYAPDDSGRMLMNFGPINKGGGEKRLNVVFSRAKRHLAVISSIGYAAITNEYNEGASCFRRYLQYAEAMSMGDEATAAVVSQALCRHREQQDHGDGDPVVEDLAAALESRGHHVDRAVGTSSFRVDLALKRGGQRVLGVLVDTARHYANNNIMERYHARPAVLGSFGWQVVWILSKEWYADREQCIKRVERTLAMIADDG